MIKVKRYKIEVTDKEVIEEIQKVVDMYTGGTFVRVFFAKVTQSTGLKEHELLELCEKHDLDYIRSAKGHFLFNNPVKKEKKKEGK